MILQAIPAYNQIFNGRVAAAEVFEIIDRKSAMDPFTDDGVLLLTCDCHWRGDR
jgi:hypothetical protein